MSAILQALLQAFLPALLAELQTPAFQAILSSILQNLLKQIASGVPATTATGAAAGQVISAATLHLSGNPIADFNAWVASLQPAASVSGSVHVPVTPVVFTS
jgi:hypothetical protein